MKHYDTIISRYCQEVRSDDNLPPSYILKNRIRIKLINIKDITRARGKERPCFGPDGSYYVSIAAAARETKLIAPDIRKWCIAKENGWSFVHD